MRDFIGNALMLTFTLSAAAAWVTFFAGAATRGNFIFFGCCILVASAARIGMMILDDW